MIIYHKKFICSEVSLKKPFILIVIEIEIGKTRSIMVYQYSE